MPFTGSHPAAAVGLSWTRLPMTAMVAGSMVPDLPLFDLAPWSYATSHSVAGIVGVDLISGLAVTVLWLLLPRAPALDLSPIWVRSRVAGLRTIPWNRAWLAVPAVVLGAATHVAWDEFTHEGRWGARHIGWLARQHGDLSGFKWAQYVSGVVGAVIVGAHWWRYVSTRPVPAAMPGAASGRAALRGALSVYLVAAVFVPLALHRDEGSYAAAYSALHQVGPLAAAGVLLTAVAWHVLLRRLP